VTAVRAENHLSVDELWWQCETSLDKGVKWLYFQAPGDNTLIEKGGLERPDLEFKGILDTRGKQHS
jgi:hypothetical protein